MTVTEVYKELAAVVSQLAVALRADDKTELNNALALHQDAGKALEDLSRTHHLAFGDLNGFKNINDAYGHATGDSVIEEAGKILKALCAKWRIGGYRKSGDEFALLIPDERLNEIVKELEKQFSECRLPVEQETITFSASFGICRMADADLETILKRAEEACQFAKFSGAKTVVHQWSEALNLKTSERRIRCSGCGTSTKCTVAETYANTPLVCPVCQLANIDNVDSNTAA